MRVSTQPDRATTPGFSLDGRVALVTGAARGLGLGIAQKLAERGAEVILNDLSEESLKAAVDTLGPTGARCRLVAADISEPEDVDRLISEAQADRGSLDILVNNAGVQVVKPLVDHTIEEWDWVLSINLRGTFLCMRAALPGMLAAGRGSIVNMSSIAAFRTTTPHASYAAAKAAIHALTRDTAYEVAPHGVRVNAIAPGPTVTEMTDALPAEVKDAIARKVPLGRWGDPSDIASAVAYLVSDEASFVTGITMPVAGGSDLRLDFIG